MFSARNIKSFLRAATRVKSDLAQWLALMDEADGLNRVEPAAP